MAALATIGYGSSGNGVRFGLAKGKDALDGGRAAGRKPGRAKSGPVLGFLLVLAAILVVAIVYIVTMFAVGPTIRTPTTAIGAMTAAFAVIGTLVGTYFGVKACLDGLEKVRKAAGGLL